MFYLNLHIQTLLNEYLKIFPNEITRYDILRKQLEEKDDISTRKNFRGHITASAYIMSNDKKKIAIIHNINLNKWLAPGGHWEEGDNEVYHSAKREAIEETGIENIELFSWHKDHNFIPIDIDTHFIPENTRKHENEHYHHDFRYIFVACDINPRMNLQLEEVKGLQWVALGERLEGFSGNNVVQKIIKVL